MDVYDDKNKDMMEKMAPGEIEEDETNEQYDSDENSDEESSSEE